MAEPRRRAQDSAWPAGVSRLRQPSGREPMDNTTQVLTSYATSLTYAHLSPEAIHNTKRSFIDTFGCAMGGINGPTSIIARKVAGLTSKNALPSRLLGTSDHTSPDMAAFANTVMVHYLNFDECWRELTFAGGFPGRSIPAILALADPLRAGEGYLITATVVSYEVCFRLLARGNFHALHWNQSVYTGPSTAAGLATARGRTPAR